MIEPEDTEIQRLIRLKRYEQPPEGFVDEFLVNFHYRQRSEILRQSSLSLFWERLVTFMDGRAVQGMSLAGATVVLLMLGGSYAWTSKSGSSSGSPAMAAATSAKTSSADFSVAPMAAFEIEDKASPQSDASLAANIIQGSNPQTTTDNTLQPDVQFVAPTTGSALPANGVMKQNGSVQNLGQQWWISSPTIPHGTHSLSPWFPFYFAPGNENVQAK